jgi:hypothetical protein
VISVQGIVILRVLTNAENHKSLKSHNSFWSRLLCIKSQERSPSNDENESKKATE